MCSALNDELMGAFFFRILQGLIAFRGSINFGRTEAACGKSESENVSRAESFGNLNCARIVYCGGKDGKVKKVQY